MILSYLSHSGIIALAVSDVQSSLQLQLLRNLTECPAARRDAKARKAIAVPDRALDQHSAKLTVSRIPKKAISRSLTTNLMPSTDGCSKLYFLLHYDV